MRSSVNKVLTAGILSLILVFSISDMAMDYLSRPTNKHLAVELFLILLTLATIGWLLSDFFKSKFRISKFKQDISLLESEKNEWRSKAEELLQGLSKTIQDQFEKWSLTKSEVDIGFMLLKGYSQNEIARMRKTSEKTVQTQSQAIYKKMNLKNRSELAAFFLEDLLPQKEQLSIT
ncbi:response regulator transcription factor, partial [bacterium]|jgi:DNA-binding CsgD family transcriptional regulator|nr:response regulator transcription factor [bacterium]